MKIFRKYQFNGSMGRERFFLNRKIFAILACLSLFSSVSANPVDGHVTAGSATISTPDATTVQINQTSDKAVIEWQSFNIASNETTRFQQPSSNSIILNRINPGQGVSEIFGHLSANGQVILINQAGIYFGPAARVDAGGLIASTNDISDKNFLAGKYVFDLPSLYAGSVINAGTIKAGNSGLVALLGTDVRNDGLVVANAGHVILAAGDEFLFDFSGDQLINFAVAKPSAKQANVSNSGKVIANGGKIIMTAAAVNGVLNSTVNMTGILVANTAYEKSGAVILSAENGITQVTGKIYANGKHGAQTGGKVHILGNQVTLSGNAKVDVSGKTGGGEILIGGDYQGKNYNILNANNTYIGRNVNLSADAVEAGNGGKVIVWANDITQFYGSISAQGGKLNGNGGFIETSGKNYLDASPSSINASAANGTSGTWLLDPRNVIIDAATTTCTSSPCFSTGNPKIYTPDTNTSHVSVSDILTALNGGTSVTITTGTTGTQTGTITVNAAITKTTGTTPVTLTLDSTNAGGTITVSNPITSTSGVLNVSLLSGNAITLNSTISTNGGNFLATAQNAITLGNGSGTTPGIINVGAGTVSIKANQDSAGTQGFTMNTGSSISSTNTTNSAVQVIVNTLSDGTGTAALRDITVGNGGTITINTSAGGNTTGGDVTQASGILNAGSNGTVTLLTPNVTGRNIGTSTANIQISAGNLNLTTGSSGAFITNLNTSNLNLGNITTSGAFNLTSINSSAITDSGIITIGGTTTLAAGSTHDITLDSLGNNFTTLVISSAKNATIVDGNSLILGASTIANNLNLTTSGDITSSGALSVAGTATFATGLHDITLNNAANDFNSVVVSNTRNAIFRDANNFVFGNFSISGNLALTTAGAITQNTGTAISINGASQTATLAAGATKDITLDNANNDFSSVVITNGKNVSLNDANNLQFGAANSTISGALTITTSGDITQLGGALLVTGLSTLNAGSHNITLDNSTNDFNTVKITSANSATIRDTTALDIGASSVANTLTLIADNGITQSGVITVPNLIATTRNNAATNITLNLNNFVNSINLHTLNAAGTANSSGLISFTNATGFDIANIGTTGNINLTAGGVLTDSGNITGATLTTHSIGGTVLDAGHTLTGFNATNTGSGNIQLVNTGTLSITGINQAGNGDINISNTGAVTLASVNTNQGNGNVGIHATDAMTLTGSLDAGAGNVTLDANTAATNKNFSMNAGSSITTTSVATDAIIINVNNISGGTGTAALRDITVGNGGTITVKTNTGGNTTGGDITQASGILNAGSLGVVTLLNPNISANNIGATNAPIKIIAGELNASSGNSGIFIKNTGTDVLTVKTLEAFRSDTNAKGSAELISNGAIQQNGSSHAINVLTLTATTQNDLGANIAFNNSNNSATNINLHSQNSAGTATANGMISYRNGSNLNITGLHTLSSASIIANGVLTDSGSIVVGNTLTTSTRGGITLDNTNQINAINITNNGGGNIVFSANTMPLTITGLNQSGGGSISFSNTSNISIANSANFITDGGALNFTTSSGTLSVGSGVAINSHNANISITATDLNLNSTSSINSGTGNISITQNTVNGSIGLGNASGSLSLSGSELQKITTNNLILNAPSNGQILVDGVTSTDVANISTTTLNATAGTLGSITFENNASFFRALTATADNGITINSALKTTVGSLVMNGGNHITLNNNLTAAGNLTLSAAINGILLVSDSAITANGITFNNTINGHHDLTLDAGSAGNIIFNSAVGNSSRLGNIYVINVNNLTSNGLISADSYIQVNGNVTNLGTQGLNLTGNANMTSNVINGALNVAGLTLNVSFANLTGFVDGLSGQNAINKINLLNTISSGTHYFDGIDMYKAPTPVPSVPNEIVQLSQNTFSYLYSYNENATNNVVNTSASSSTNSTNVSKKLGYEASACTDIGGVTVCAGN